MGFSRQEHWSGLPFPSPGTLPDPGIEPESLVHLALAGRFCTTAPLEKLIYIIYILFKFFSITGYHGILNIVSSAIQQVPVGYLFNQYVWQCVSVNPKLLIYPWARPLNILCLGFLICEMVMAIVASEVTLKVR